jgi:hypothetical protein
MQQFDRLKSFTEGKHSSFNVGMPGRMKNNFRATIKVQNAKEAGKAAKSTLPKFLKFLELTKKLLQFCKKYSWGQCYKTFLSVIYGFSY